MALASFTQALATAASTSSWPQGLCDAFVAHCYGLSASGYQTAALHWQSSSQKHPGDTNAPAGALVFWSGGSQGFGHVAIADGSGGIYSTDISGPGTVSHVSLGTITAKWGLTYLGWAAPQFGGSIAQTGTATGGSGSLASAAMIGGPVGGTAPAPPPSDDTCVLSMPLWGCIFNKSQARALIGGFALAGGAALFLAGVAAVLKYGLGTGDLGIMQYVPNPVNRLSKTVKPKKTEEKRPQTTREKREALAKQGIQNRRKTVPKQRDSKGRLELQQNKYEQELTRREARK